MLYQTIFTKAEKNSMSRFTRVRLSILNNSQVCCLQKVLRKYNLFKKKAFIKNHI
jgi:hypothetical protein